MTYKQIQDAVMRRLNLSSTDARTRIKDIINDKYAEIATSVNLALTRSGSANITVTGGNPVASVTGVAKIHAIYDPTFLKNTLSEITLDQIRDMDAAGTVTGVPYAYAVTAHNATSITIQLYPIPSASNTLKADITTAFVPLVADADEPRFPADFHDLLVDATLVDEYMKLEKSTPLAQMAQARAESRLSDLRYFIAKAAYLRRVPRDAGLPGQLSGRTWPYANLA